MIIFAPDLSNYHDLTHAISIRTQAKYGNIGKFIINLPIDAENIKNTVLNSVIYDDNKNEAYIVASRQISTEKKSIEIRGYSAEWLLSKRAILQPKYYPATENGIYQIIKDNLRGMPIETAEIKGLGGQGSLYATEGQLLDAVLEMAQMNEFGVKTAFNPYTKKFIFEVYKGQDLTKGLKAQIFSYERGNATALTINEDSSLYASAFIAKGEVNGITYYGRYETGTLLGDERIIDCGGWGMSPPPSQSVINEYIKSLETQAKRAAQTYTIRQNFKVEINSDEYGTMYGLGDIVTCISDKFGVKFDKRITEVEYTLDANGSKTHLILGEPELTKTEADKLGGY